MEATTTAVSKVVTTKKKKTRYFETYMLKIVKKISESNAINNNAKQQLNSVISSVAKMIADKAINLTELSKKKTMSEKEVINAIKITLPEDLWKNILVISETSVKNYNNAESGSKSSRQDKAGIIFPPSITEKYLRSYGNSKLMVTDIAPIYLAVALEYLTEEILKNAIEYLKDKKHVRISIRDLEMGVRNDAELNMFFKKNNIMFLGGGVVPYIHPSLFTKKQRKTGGKTTKTDDEKKKHRFRPGTVSLREIRRYQKSSNCLTLAKFPFQKLVRDSVVKKIGEEDGNNIKISKDVFVVMQYFIEQLVINVLHNANFAAIHCGRIKVMPNDITFVNFLMNKTPINPYENNNNETTPLELEVLSEEEEEDEGADESTD